MALSLRFAVTTIAACALSACSLFTSLDGYAGGADGPPDGTAPSGDATATGDASSTDSASREGATGDGSFVDLPNDGGEDVVTLPNLHPNGTFETQTAPWGGFQGTVGLDGTAHTGASSLRACTSPTTSDYFTADDSGTLMNPVIGKTYRAEAWVRSAPGAAVPPSARLTLRAANVTGGFQLTESDFDDSNPLSATWQKVSVTLKITKPAQLLGVNVGAYHSPGACFLLDDVTLVRLD